MSSADATAIFVILFVPTVLVARWLVRSSRGERFTQGELMTVAGAVVVGAGILVLTRGPAILALALPLGIIAFGLILLGRARQQMPRSSLAQAIAYAALAVGIGGLFISIVRTATGT